MLRILAWGLALSAAGLAHGEVFELMIGVDAGHYPGMNRDVTATPGPCCTTSVPDGDRLAGNLPLGDAVVFLGNGTPLFAPNEFGSLSFMYRRGSVPSFGSQFPLQGIDFLGGPLLDLDGDAGNGARSLIPVSGQTAVTLPQQSRIGLSFDLPGGVVTLDEFDATGTNEGGPGIPAGIATTVNTLAGTLPDGSATGPINPDWDTRQGTVTAFTGSNGLLAGVYRIEGLGYEFWQDTLLASSATAADLGTFQFLGSFRGWWVQRDAVTGEFPTLTGAGLGDTLWPLVDTTGLGVVIDTANNLAGTSAFIAAGYPNDDFTVPGNGGGSSTALGPYFDAVVIPRVHPLSDGFIYLESAGFGTNNSGDPIYLDTVSYDAVIIAQSAPRTDLRDFAAFQGCFTGPGPAGLTGDCENYDLDSDSDVDTDDLAGLTAILRGPV
jgi:hypothetical protein